MGTDIKVKKVQRKAGQVLYVIIESGPFDLTFFKTKNKVHLGEFVRYDGSQDEAFHIPKNFFYPAIKVAAAIFSEGR